MGNQSYTLSERASERMAIAVRAFMDLWAAEHGPTLPSVQECETFIEPFLSKEVESRVWGAVKMVEDMRVETVEKLKHDASLRMMISNAKIEERLPIEYL